MRGQQAQHLYQQWSDETQLAVADADALNAEITQALLALTTERRAAAADLARLYLPTLDAESLAAAPSRAGFRGFDQRRPIDAMEKERRQLTARLAVMEADERFTQREALVGPYGSLTRAVAEARDLLDPWERECARFEEQLDFLELVDVGYDTPAFTERWWSPSYWRHWAAGDRICEALGLSDFGDDVLPAWEKVRAPREQWRGEVSRIGGQIDSVHGHVKLRDETAWRLENLAMIYLEECQNLLATHLEGADAALLAQWAGDDRALILALKKLAGLGAKLDMLRQMQTDWLAGSRTALAEAAQRHQLKATKLARPKKAALEVVVPEGVEAKLQASRLRREKARASVRRIVRYDRYERYDLGQPSELWYLEINGCQPGLFAPRYRAWYDRNPNVGLQYDPEYEQERAEALRHMAPGPDRGDVS